MKKLLKEKRKHLFSFLMVVMFLAVPVLGLGLVHPASADIVTNIEGNLTATGLQQLGDEGANLPKTIGNVVGVLLGLLGVVFVLIVIYAGFMWMMAQGDETKITKARKTIIQGVVAIVIIFMAYAITSFVIAQIGKTAAGGTAG